MQCLFFLRGLVMGCLLMLASATGLWALHAPAHATQTSMVHASMHMAGHSMAAPVPMHHSSTAVGCPSTTAAAHHLMHHHAACCMTGNALSVVDTSVGVLPMGFLWPARHRPAFPRQTALPDRRAAPLLRPPKLHTA